MIILIQWCMQSAAERQRRITPRRFYPPRWLGTLLLTLVWLLPTGCGQREPLARVSGQVTYEGTPVKEGLVLFSNDALGIHMTADIVQGRYKIVTARARGIPPGEYQVAIAPPAVDHPVGPILEPPRDVVPPDIPPRYHDAQTSGLVVRLVDGDNTADFEMKEAGE